MTINPTGLVAIRTDGGIGSLPGLSAPRSATFAALEPTRAREILDLVAATRFFDRGEAPSDPNVRDGRIHYVLVDHDGRCRTLRVSEPIADQALADLVRVIRETTAPI